ncbi:hypothetical protein L3X38_040652 [Prunus dulcis]|uniref:Uncharacterized protein n=1 Tax=Prunus dulcis TaxID=3755 RepID=A0AAD4VAM6_PRUDU|nr:hypothetical protein L3X38_040652 [Prunus dulcis]
MKVDVEQFPPTVSTCSKLIFNPKRLDKAEIYGLRSDRQGPRKGLGESVDHIYYCFRSTGERLLEYWADDSLLPNSPINLIEFQHESDDDDVLAIDDLHPAPTKMEDSHPEA